MDIVWLVEAELILNVGISASTDSVNMIFTVRMRNREMTRRKKVSNDDQLSGMPCGNNYSAGKQ